MTRNNRMCVQPLHAFILFFDLEAAGSDCKGAGTLPDPAVAAAAGGLILGEPATLIACISARSHVARTRVPCH